MRNKRTLARFQKHNFLPSSSVGSAVFFFSFKYLNCIPLREPTMFGLWTSLSKAEYFALPLKPKMKTRYAYLHCHVYSVLDRHCTTNGICSTKMAGKLYKYLVTAFDWYSQAEKIINKTYLRHPNHISLFNDLVLSKDKGLPALDQRLAHRCCCSL